MPNSQNKQPNILVIMTDQMTPFMLGAYGHPQVQTPHLDALARRGTRFDAAYSPIPICVPARAAMMTGQYASHIGCYDNGDAFASYVPTFAHYLTNAGYDTVLSGKMHFVGADQLHGFRTRLTTDVYPSTYDWSYEPPADDAELAFEFHKQYLAPQIGAGWTLELQYDEETHFRSVEFLRQKHENPFLLVSSYTNPHPPFIAPQQFWDMYADVDFELPHYPDDLEESYSDFDRALRRWHGIDQHDIGSAENLLHMRRGYAAVISYIDHKVGELLAVLEEQGLRDDTVVLFCADHGEMLGEKRMIQKRSLYEWSARIPLIVDLPQQAQPSVVESPVSLIDLHPTLLDIAGVPEAEWTPLDGVSLLSVMEVGDSAESRPIFCEYHAEGVMNPSVMVRQANFKYHYFHQQAPQLFNVGLDPDERENLAGLPEYADIEAQLRDAILTQFDIDTIVPTMLARLKQKIIVRKAMHRNGTHWDYQPHFDATKQYMRTSADNLYERK